MVYHALQKIKKDFFYFLRTIFLQRTDIINIYIYTRRIILFVKIFTGVN